LPFKLIIQVTLSKHPDYDGKIVGMTNQLQLVTPNTKVRLGLKKLLSIARKQDAIEAIAIFTVVFVTVTFLLDGGASFNGLYSYVDAVDRLTALVATDLLLIQTMLIARVPWLDRLYGHDRSTAVHKKLGKPVLYLIIAHFLASVWAYAILDSKNVIDELVNMVNNVPDMLTALIAFICMILVVVTSIKIARKKLSYEAWYIVHLLAYGAILFAIPHQFSTGVDIYGKPVAMAFWVGAYFFVAGNIVWFRFLNPIVYSFLHGLRIEKVQAESSDASSIYVSGSRLSKIGTKSGQFFILRVLTKDDWWRAHPFSISAAPTDKSIRFTIGVRGDDTKKLQTVKPGTRVILEGPYGVFTEDRRTQEKVTLIAAGIGAPPIRALAENIAARPGDVSIVYRVRNADDAPLVEELREIARRRGFFLHVLDGKRAHNASWLPAGGDDSKSDHERLTALIPGIAKSDVYICGPAAWTQTVEKSLHKAGTPLAQIHAEEFAW